VKSGAEGPDCAVGEDQSCKMGRQRGYPRVMEMPMIMKAFLPAIIAIHVYELMVIKIAVKRGCWSILPKWFGVQTSLNSIVGRDVAMSYCPDSGPMHNLPVGR
jgi:hypothetical protein